MTKRIPAGLALLALLTGGVAISVAQEGGQSGGEHKAHHGAGMHHDGMGGGPDGQFGAGRFRDPARMIEMMQRHLDLDELQTQQLNNILEAVRPELEAAKTAFRENREAIRALDTSAPDYSAKLQNLSSANAELAGAMTLLFGGIRADVHAVLTPEQVQILEASGPRNRGHGHKRRDHGEPNPETDSGQ